MHDRSKKTCRLWSVSLHLSHNVTRMLTLRRKIQMTAFSLSNNRDTTQDIPLHFKQATLSSTNKELNYLLLQMVTTVADLKWKKALKQTAIQMTTVYIYVDKDHTHFSVNWYILYCALWAFAGYIFYISSCPVEPSTSLPGLWRDISTLKGVLKRVRSCTV